MARKTSKLKSMLQSHTEEVKEQPKAAEAMAEALRQGRLGVMDYYRMNNINADTQMRKAISGEDTPEEA